MARATYVRVHNMPAEMTSFVNRRGELAQAREMLSASRLVTLTGPGGVGKTRLALRVAGAKGRSFPGGIWFVDLAPLQNPALLAHTVVQALEIGDQTVRDPVDVLLAFLRDKRSLLLLDNCERVAVECARLATTLLGAAPKLHILVTSRQTLGIPGEHVLEVAPFEAPAPEWVDAPRAEPESPAVMLFAERARAFDPSFVITPDNLDTVARVCHQLDGIPLAIELAAARLHRLPLAELAAGLGERARLLIPGPRTQALRHRTLYATLSWSFELCGELERLMWARVSVFSGSFDLSAAEAVCAGGGIDAEDVLDLLAELIDKSVLLRDEQDGQVRYRLLDTVRQFGLERLRETGEEDVLRSRHRDWYLHLAERGDAEWFGPHQVAWFHRLRREHANLRAVLSYCLSAPGEARAGLGMATTLWFYWLACGFVAEGCHWIERALELETQPTRERAKALWVDGYLTGFSGYNPDATGRFEEARDLARRLGDEPSDTYASQLLGLAAAGRGEMVLGERLLAEALELHRAHGRFDAIVAMGRVMLAYAALGNGDLDGAVSLCRDARKVSEAHGDIWVLSWALWVLSLAAWSRDQVGEAAELARECLRIKQIFHDVLGMAFALDMLVWTAVRDGAHERAAVLLGAAETTWLTMGQPLANAPDLVDSRQRSEASLRRALGDRAFEEAVKHGMDLDLDEATAYALAHHSVRTR